MKKLSLFQENACYVTAISLLLAGYGFTRLDSQPYLVLTVVTIVAAVVFGICWQLYNERQDRSMADEAPESSFMPHLHPLYEPNPLKSAEMLLQPIRFSLIPKKKVELKENELAAPKTDETPATASRFQNAEPQVKTNGASVSHQDQPAELNMQAKPKHIELRMESMRWRKM